MEGLNGLRRRSMRAIACLMLGWLTTTAPPQAAAQLIPRQITQPVDNAISNSVDRSVDSNMSKTLQSAIETGVDSKLVREALSKVTQTTDPLLDKILQTPILPAPRESLVEDNWRAVDHEWVALLKPEQVPALGRAGVRILSVRTLATSHLVLVRVLVSDRDNNPAAAQALLKTLGATAADRNHVYDTRQGPAPSRPAPSLGANPLETSGRRLAKNALIGLVDTSLNHKHPAFKTARVLERDFVESSRPRPKAHGTSIAALLVGAETGHEGLLKGGRLIAASVFYQGDSGATGATTAALVAALDWLTAQKVQVVNMSLAGPPNEVLAAVIEDLWARGVVIVAAVGNDGPASRPLYPAGYPTVVAVTAVDRKNQIYRWANQGAQVKFAAWGVGESVAQDKGGYYEESGTSFAAPIVAARLAQLMEKGATTASEAVQSLIRSAEDLGPPGRDDIFGYGLIRPAAN